MPIFIDESGSPGGGINDPRPYYRLCAVWIPTDDIHSELIGDLRMLPKLLKLKQGHEFKFSKTAKHPERRLAFFNVMLKQSVRFTFCSINKTLPEWKDAPTSRFYQHASEMIAMPLLPVLLEHQRALRFSDPAFHLRAQVRVDDWVVAQVG